MTDVSSLSSRRKRGTGVNERTTVSLSTPAKKLVDDLNLNLSAWVEKKLFEEFEPSENKTLVRLQAKFKTLEQSRDELSAEMRLLNATIQQLREQEEEFREEEAALESAPKQNNGHAKKSEEVEE